MIEVKIHRLRFANVITLIFCSFFLYFLPSEAEEPPIQWFYNLPPNDNPGGLGLRRALIDEIDEARDSIEGAFYQINDPFIVAALIRAKERGVDLFLTTDTDWVKHPDYIEAYQRLADADIHVISDKRRHLNHNKYCIIDRRLDRARVWVGSYNITVHGIVENGDAAFLMIDPVVAEVFYADFRQMANGKFQSQKGGVFLIGDEIAIVEDTRGPKGLDEKDFRGLNGQINYPKREIGNSKVEFYFSPQHNVQRKIVEAIYLAKESIHFAAYTLDDRMIYQALMNKAYTPALSTPYNIYPVSIRQDPWENLVKKLRIVGENGTTFLEDVFSKETWEEWSKITPDLFGKESEGRFFPAARYFYPTGAVGGKIQKVSVHGVFNWLGLSRGPYTEMVERGLHVRKTAMPGNLHSKFIIIDRETLILGSYNFSNNAEKNNDESLIIVHDPEIIENFYQTVFKSTYMNAYPEYMPDEEELEKFSYHRRNIILTEIHFVPKKGLSNARFVEVFNKAFCETSDECDALTVELTGWKLWNGLIPLHDSPKVRGSTDVLISYFNDPYTNKFGLNHPTKGYFLNPELETLRPGEYGLIVGRNFNLVYLDKFRNTYEESFEKRYGRKPEKWYEKYPKLFVSSSASDTTVGDGLMPYQFLTLFYPDKFTISDRFTHNLFFQDLDESRVKDVDDLLSGNTALKLNLVPGQSLERRHMNEERLSANYQAFKEIYQGEEYVLYGYGLESYSEPKDWEPNRDKTATPGFGYAENKW